MEAHECRRPMLPTSTMETAASNTSSRRRRPGALVSVLAVVLALAGIWAPAASAATGVGPETRVRAIDHPTVALIGRGDLGSSTGVRVSGPDIRRFVSATGVATNSVGNVGLEGNDLAKAAATWRRATGTTDGNYAVFEVADGDGFRYLGSQNVPGGAHSERVIRDQLAAGGVDFGSVTRIYSELQPCDFRCTSMIGRDFTQAQVSWSFDYNPKGSIRDAGRDAWKARREGLQ